MNTIRIECLYNNGSLPENNFFLLNVSVFTTLFNSRLRNLMLYREEELNLPYLL